VSERRRGLRAAAYNGAVMGMRRQFLAFLLVGWFGSTLALDASAGAPEAERYRLQTELDQLARKGAWPGVERTYGELEKLGLELRLDDYVLGAQAAIHEGDLMTALVRVQVGLASSEATDDPDSAYMRAKAISTNLESRFGQVRVKIANPKLCKARVLLLTPKPFAEDERQAHETARTALLTSEHFTGMLPAGNYSLGGSSPFVVEPGQPMKTIEVCTGAD